MIVPWPCANILTQYNMYVLELGLGKTVNTVSRRQQEIDGEIRDVFLRWGFLKIITQDHATNVDVYVPSHSLENSARWHGNLIGLTVKGTKLFGPTNAAN